MTGLADVGEHDELHLLWKAVPVVNVDLVRSRVDRWACDKERSQEKGSFRYVNR